MTRINGSNFAHPTLLVVWGEGLGQCELPMIIGWQGWQVRLGLQSNENLKMDFTSEKSVLLVDFNWEIQIRISWISFFIIQFGNPKSAIRFSKLFLWKAAFFLLIMRARARPLFLRTVFQILFWISKRKGKEENPRTVISALKSVFGFWVWLQIWNLDFKI